MLIACKECGRYIKSHEAQCPFCQEGAVQMLPKSSRLQRAAAVALVGASLGLVGCPREGQRTKYGAPPIPSSEPTSQPDSAPTNEPAAEPERPANKYGAPPPPKREE